MDFAPDAPELCDGFDDNCNGLVPGDEADADADTWLECAGALADTFGLWSAFALAASLMVGGLLLRDRVL